MFYKISQSLVFVLNLLDVTMTANILVLHPLYAGSHEFTLRTVGERLVERGHTVTQVLAGKEGVLTVLQVRYAQTDSHYDLNTTVDVITLRYSSLPGV